MNKVTLKTFYNRYTRGTLGPVPFEKGFSISTTTTTQFEQLSTLSVSNFNLEKGDEIIVPFKTGGAYRGWFLGVGKSEKHVCLYWTPFGNNFYIVDIMAVPVRCDWTKFVSNQRLEVAKDQIEFYKKDNNKTFTLDIPV